MQYATGGPNATAKAVQAPDIVIGEGVTKNEMSAVASLEQAESSSNQLPTVSNNDWSVSPSMAVERNYFDQWFGQGQNGLGTAAGAGTDNSSLLGKSIAGACLLLASGWMLWPQYSTLFGVSPMAASLHQDWMV